MTLLPCVIRILYLKIFLLFIIAGIYCGKSMPAETHSEEVIRTILNQKKVLEEGRSSGEVQTPCATSGACVFITVWDFDGTILKGDTSEGLIEREKVIFQGLLREGIEAGLSSRYPGPAHQEKFWRDYREMEKESPVKAYGYLVQMFAGTDVKVLGKLARTYFTTTLEKYYFTSSLKIFNALKTAGVEPYIVSAAPDVFVSEAGPGLSLRPDQIHGVEGEIKDGKLTDRLIEPITYHQGKTEKLKQIIVDLKKRPGVKEVYVLAGFGNSYHTDAHFLSYIEALPLPGGKPLTLMINGGEAPPQYNGRFMRVEQKKIRGAGVRAD